ncbi:MAG TPA: MBL fold metallo-hydrolase [Gaiellales bacterium]|nr:MBL fold metallo-hydrolase [Gaiellales bacterium]
MSRPAGPATLQLVGGPTALIAYGGLRILTDPTFDPPGERRSSGTPVVLTKLTGPAVDADAIQPLDAVLVSHDHHADNLDTAGRELLSHAGRVLTTSAGAERLGGGATGLEPGDEVDLNRPEGGTVTVTAVAAEHGPPEVAAVNGPVIGFVLRGDGLPTVYVSGDNASVEVVRTIAAAHGPFDAAVLFTGNAQVPARWGPDVPLTLTPAAAVEAARILDPAVVIAVHQEGWAHFTSGPQDLEQAFAAAGLSDRLRSVSPGGVLELVPRS